MTGYRHPGSYRPQLVYGGHQWTLHNQHATCVCAATIPVWALTEGWWPALTHRYCLARVRAIAPPAQRTLPGIT